MSDIDPDIQKPDEEPKIPSDQPPETPDQSAPQPLDEAVDADAEKTLEDMQELLDQVSSLENESDEMALKDIASQLPQNQDKGESGEPGGAGESGRPGEEAASTVPPVSDAGQSEIASQVDGEANTEGVVSPDLAALDDDLAELLDDVDKIIVQAESDPSVSSETKIPVESEVISEHAAEALPTHEEPAIEDVSSGEPGGIATDDEEVLDAAKAGSLDAKVDEGVVVEPLTPESETTPPAEAEPSPPPEAETPQDSTEDTVPGGMDESLDLTSEIDSLLTQVKVEQQAKPPEPKKTPDVPTPKIISPPPATDDSNLDDLSSDINDLLASVVPQSESNENPAAPEPPPPDAPAPDTPDTDTPAPDTPAAEAPAPEAPAPDTQAPPVQVPEASTPTEAVDTMTQGAAPPPDTVSEALPGESESPPPSSVPEEQPVAEEPASIIDEPAPVAGEPAPVSQEQTPAPQESSPVAAESASASDVSKKEEKPAEIKPLSNVPLTPQDIAMRALDEVMADDVAQMMAGDTETIEGVLDGIFDEQAILVQNDENFMNDSAMAGIAQSDDPKGEEKELPGSPAGDVGVIGEVIEEEIAAISPPETQKETPAAIDSETGETDQESTSQDTPKPTEAPSGAEAPTVEVTSSQPQPSSTAEDNKWKVRAQAAFEIIEPPLVMVLTGMNYPLRKIPKKLRPAVDWLALSLVFWVPIVWVLALFMG